MKTDPRSARQYPHTPMAHWRAPWVGRPCAPMSIGALAQHWRTLAHWRAYGSAKKRRFLLWRVGCGVIYTPDFSMWMPFETPVGYYS